MIGFLFRRQAIVKAEVNKKEAAMGRSDKLREIKKVEIVYCDQ